MDAGHCELTCRMSPTQDIQALHDRQAALGHCVEQVLRSRRSTRAYKPDLVSAQAVLDILDCAATAPSNSNTQPWRVHVLAGAPLCELGDALVKSFREDLLPPSSHFPDPLPAEFGARQADFASRYYGCLGIDRLDAAARSAQTERNFHFFGAPVGLIFSIDSRLTAHSWLDLGLFVQSVMIAAGARGLATCPQVSFARFHPVIASRLRMPAHYVTACGMSMGFAQSTAPVNQVRMPRASALEFAQLAGFS
ncbi:nitroreductase [Variovorax sp. J22R115]|uniref:nitroreductase n=1 Tax=Variovorax sp. J22R115 TaxID=3053509 RepID=UPI003014CA36